MDMMQGLEISYYVVTIISGIVTAGLGGFFGWFFTRKQYNSQVKQQDITNIDAAITTWQNIVNSLETRVNKLLEECTVLRGENEQLVREISQLRNEIISLKSQSRKIMSYEKQIKDYQDRISKYEQLLIANGIAY